MRRVFMRPSSSEAAADDSNSINQIVLRLKQLLPKYGWELTETIDNADIIAAHAGQEGDLAYCDVAHCHGLYPTGMYDSPYAYYYINRLVADNILCAKRVTVPSQWVADVISRSFNIAPTIVPWAIDINEWNYGNHKGYGLWNKTRHDMICDPEPIRYLAENIPAASFVSTFLEQPPSNVSVVGRKSFGEMHEIIQNASIYIATTKETFGIGILEAMACGQPILAYDWGAVPDFVKHGVHGFLAAPGNFDDLVNGWHYCMEHRAVLGHNARKAAETYSWDNVARDFARVYSEVDDAKKVAPVEAVTVVIPAHNYANYLPQAVNSAMHQETNFSYTVMVVNDASTDDTKAVMKNLQSAYASQNRAHLAYIENPQNLHVADTRNAGIKAALGKYIVCLDADDCLGDPKYLQTLYDYMENHPKCGIAYTRLATFNSETPDYVELSDWPRECSPQEQFMGHNQVPTCCMFRKDAWQRAGGYKSYVIPSEDAELWSKIMMLGYTAELAVNEPWFYYRWHDASLTRGKKAAPAVNWLMFQPWNAQRKYPISAVVKAPKESWPVYNFDKPYVSIVVPIGPGHQRYINRALDSIYAQSYWNWECILVNDTGQPLETYPWVKVINASGEIRFGSAAKARNAGLKKASGLLVTFLDADDFWDNHYLMKTVRLYQSTGKYIYTDYVSLKKNGLQEIGQTHEYSLHRVFNDAIIHTINILIPLSWVKAAGYFDETMSTWEDIDLFFKLAIRGYCGKRLPEALTFYDYGAGTLREKGNLDEAELKQLIYSRYSDYMEPVNKMCECVTPPQRYTSNELASAAQNGDMVRIQYSGPAAPHSVLGASKHNYGRRADGDFFWVWRQDYEAQPNKFKFAPEIMTEIAETEMPPDPVKL